MRKPLFSQQQGYTLLEVALFMTLAMTLSIGYLRSQISESQYNLAKTQAGLYRQINDAVTSYMLTYHLVLRDIPGECSTVALRVGATPSGIATGTNCRFTGGAASSPVNALQPTLAELRGLSMLDRNLSDRLLFPTDLVVRNPSGITSNGTYAVRIQRWCNGALVTNATPCPTLTQLRSLVFNTQPFQATGLGSYLSMTRFDFMNTALTAMGSNGFASLDTNTSRSLLALSSTAISSPILDDAGNLVKGILAIGSNSDINCSSVL
jgi:hypothetical protein